MTDVERLERIADRASEQLTKTRTGGDGTLALELVRQLANEIALLRDQAGLA